MGDIKSGLLRQGEMLNKGFLNTGFTVCGMQQLILGRNLETQMAANISNQIVLTVLNM
jgi:hypothetical protein